MEIQEIEPLFPSHRQIRHAVSILERGGLIVYPTDTIYGIGCDIFNKSALERILKIKKSSRQKLLSFICPDLKNISQWAFVPNYAYRIMRRIVPGKFTFVLRASHEVPKLLVQKRDTVGIRIPDAPVALRLAESLGRPLLSTSVPLGEDGFYSDPAEIAETFRHQIDLLLDAGEMHNIPSTVVDFTGNEPVILREGAGDPQLLFS